MATCCEKSRSREKSMLNPNFLILMSFGSQMCVLHYAKKRRAGSDGSMSASGSAGPGFNPRQGSKFSFENFQPRG